MLTTDRILAMPTQHWPVIFLHGLNALMGMMCFLTHDEHGQKVEKAAHDAGVSRKILLTVSAKISAI